MRTQHQGNFKYNCEQHNWHSENKAVYENHMVTKHGTVKEGPVSDYKCKKCQKVFTGKHLLANHLDRGTCNLPKKFHAHFATGTLKQRLILCLSTLNSSIYKLWQSLHARNAKNVWVLSKQWSTIRDGITPLRFWLKVGAWDLPKNGTTCCCC